MRPQSPALIHVATAMLGLWLATTSSVPALALPQQGQCEWRPIPGQLTQGHFHVASAMSTDRREWFLYGGVDQSNDVVSFLGVVDLTDPDITKADHRTLSIAGPLKRFGAAGAYRPAGDGSAVYWIAGGNADGGGEDDVQEFIVGTGAWRSIRPPGPFPPRLFHAAAYDPEHDAIVVHGGTGRCRATVAPDPDECRGANLGTSFLVFPPGSGAPRWEAGPAGGPGQVFGHSMVYDPLGKRMLVFGGAKDASRARNEVYALDLSDASLANAKWSKLTTAGRAPSARLLHSTAFDVPNNRMVIYGGVTRAPFTGRENADASTFALDFASDPPVWTSVLSAVGARVGAAMDFDPHHGVVMLHGGRGRFKTGAQNALRDSHWLQCGPPPPTATPSPTITLTPRPPTVTPTPSPTATRGPVTDTPTPSDTPVPTDTATATTTVTPSRTPTPEPERLYLPMLMKQ